ncbi:MAG: SRPBCC family protein, partial [Catalinimonas sp.]
LLFTALDPPVPFDDWLRPVWERVGWLPLDELRPAPDRDADYEVAAHWALYCDNYLEGFHVPYVHPDLNRAIDYGTYTTECFTGGSLQRALDRTGGPTFTPPPGHPDAGLPVAAYYFWCFPNVMLNFYPWGLSLNVVQPLNPTRTRVLFRTYTWPDADAPSGAGGDLNQVELEDEAVVEQVQRGVRSRLYRRGRFAPTREQGVHHFHQMVAGWLG